MAVMVRPRQRGTASSTTDGGLAQQRWWVTLTLVATELVLLVIVVDLYDLVVAHAGPDAVVAAVHSRSVWGVENVWGLDVERAWYGVLAQHRLVADVAHAYYAYSIFLAPAAVAILLLVRDVERYRSMRRTFVITTLLAYGAFWLYPLAPPCLLPGSGMVCLEPPPPDAFAAMPSLHVAWAGVTAVGLAMLGPRVRAAGVGHVLITIAVVLATGHHFVLDTLAGLTVVLVSLLATRFLHPLPAALTTVLRPR